MGLYAEIRPASRNPTIAEQGARWVHCRLTAACLSAPCPDSSPFEAPGRLCLLLAKP